MSDGEAAPTTEPTPAPEAAPERPLSLLAAESFGSDYKGEVKRTPEPATEAPAEAPESDEGKEPAEAAPEGEEAPEEPGEEDGEPITSLSDLIAHYELDPEWATTLRVPVKVNGEAAEATLKDLVDGYQMRSAAEQRLAEAKTQAKAIQDGMAEKAKALDGTFATAAKLIESAEKYLNEETAGIDWQKLRTEDPAEYAARREEVKERRERIDTMKREAVQSYQEGIAKQQADADAAKLKRLPEEQAALLEKLPEWKDPERAQADKSKAVQALLGMGFTQEDIKVAAYDHRLLVLAHKARMFDDMQANTDAAKKKVAKVPRMMKPGTPKPVEQQSKEKLAKLQAKLRTTGSLDDAMELLRAQRTGGR